MDPRVEAARTVLVENGQLGVPRYVVREALAAADAVGGQPPIVLTDEERERVVRLLSSPVAPGPTKTLDETILRKLSAGAVGDQPRLPNQCDNHDWCVRPRGHTGFCKDDEQASRSDAVQSPGQGEDRTPINYDMALQALERSEAEVANLDSMLLDAEAEVTRLRAHWDEENRHGTELMEEVETLRARCDELTEALDDITFSASIRNDDGVQALGDLADEIRAKFKLDKTGDDA